MSELEIYHCDEWHNPYTEFYLKHEADQVIIQQKRKRCLLRSVIAEMKAVHFKNLFYETDCKALANAYNEQITIHFKYQKLWLALADKYTEKETKQ